MVASAQPQPVIPVSPSDYLDWEARQETRHEFIDGEVIAMTGGTIAHNDIALNCYRALYPQVKNQGCRLNVADVKVEAKRGERYFYPDLVISCHPDDLTATQYIQHPTVIIEVLSPGTANHDRSKKLRYYRQIPSLQQYTLINTDQILVESYLRQTTEMWGYCDYDVEATLSIPSLEFEISVSTLYENVTLEPEV